MGNPQVLCTTSMGEFTCEVYLDTMPITSSNFLDLVRWPRTCVHTAEAAESGACRVATTRLDWRAISFAYRRIGFPLSQTSGNARPPTCG